MRWGTLYPLAGILAAVIVGCGNGSAGDWRRPPKCEGFDACQRSCDGGDGDACATAADLVGNGEYVAVDHGKMKALLARACELGTPRACEAQANQLGTEERTEATALRKRAFELRKTQCEQQKSIPACRYRAYQLEVGWDKDTGEGKDASASEKLRVQMLEVTKKKCESGEAEGCLEAGSLSGPSLAKETAETWKAAKPFYERACKLDAKLCGSLARTLNELGDPSARAVIDAACDASEEGSACYDGKNHGDVELLRKWTDKKRAACAKGLREACVSLAQREPDGWATVRTPEERAKDREAAMSMLRRECDAGEAHSCMQLGLFFELDANGKLASGPAVLEATLLEEKACALGDKWACAGRDRHPLIRDVVAVYPGPSHLCVRRTTGEIACLGVGVHGAAGLEDGSKLGLTPIALPSPPREVVAAFRSTCALLPEGVTMCWGEDFAGDHAPSHLPFVVPALAGVKHLSASTFPDRVCAELGDHTAHCFGSLKGPLKFEGIDQALSVGVGALTRKADVLTWSSGMDEPERLTIEPADGQVDASEGGICTLRPDRTVACAAINFGNRDVKTGRVKLAPVPGVVDAVELSMAVNHGCARKADGHVVCWTLPDKAPVVLEGLDDATQLADACAATKRGFAFCWGGRYDVPFGAVEPLRISPENSRTH